MTEGFPKIHAITAQNKGYGGDDGANPNRGPLKLIDADGNELGLIWRSSINEKQARMAVALADLFAAAPDMLEALKAWVAMARDAIDQYGVDPHPIELARLEQAEAAIAKATA